MIRIETLDPHTRRIPLQGRMKVPVTLFISDAIWVESRFGEGSIFHFTLPLKRGSESACVAALARDREVEAGSALRILLAEDSIDNQQLIAEAVYLDLPSLHTVSRLSDLNEPCFEKILDVILQGSHRDIEEFCQV